MKRKQKQHPYEKSGIQGFTITAKDIKGDLSRKTYLNEDELNMIDFSLSDIKMSTKPFNNLKDCEDIDVDDLL